VRLDVISPRNPSSPLHESATLRVAPRLTHSSDFAKPCHQWVRSQ
jgi:hypothetical protein